MAAETEAADVSESDKIRRNNLAFSRILGEINDVITRMSETTSTAYVRVVNQNLGSLTTTSRAGDTIEQKQALERLGGPEGRGGEGRRADLRRARHGGRADRCRPSR